MCVKEKVGDKAGEAGRNQSQDWSLIYVGLHGIWALSYKHCKNTGRFS